MPCSDPIMTDTENRAYRVSKLIMRFYNRGMLVTEPPRWIMNNDALWPMQNAKQRLNEVTAMLCEFCKAMGEEFIYNGRDPDCRALADWWDEHKVLDARAGYGG